MENIIVSLRIINIFSLLIFLFSFSFNILFLYLNKVKIWWVFLLINKGSELRVGFAKVKRRVKIKHDYVSEKLFIYFNWCGNSSIFFNDVTPILVGLTYWNVTVYGSVIVFMIIILKKLFYKKIFLVEVSLIFIYIWLKLWLKLKLNKKYFDVFG
jgi:hypothetical protein